MRNSININPEIKQYVENSILPRYSCFDAGHQIDHALHVITSSLSLAQKLAVDINMAYTIAAFHDLGLEGPRETHHLQSGVILENDETLKQWFSPEQITIMREAVEDHRASAKRHPRSIYGKIVSEADRDLSPEHVIRRCLQYGLAHNSDFSKEQHFLRTTNHLKEKYGEGGYIHLWLPESDNAIKLAELRKIINDSDLLKKEFNRIYKEETK